MRSLIIAMSILLAMLAWLFFSYYILHGVSDKNVEKLQVIYNLVNEEKWDEANNALSILKNDYRSKENFLKTLVDHAEMDSIESSLIAVEEFTKTHSKADSLDATARSIFLMKHIEEKNKFNFENVL